MNLLNKFIGLCIMYYRFLHRIFSFVKLCIIVSKNLGSYLLDSCIISLKYLSYEKYRRPVVCFLPYKRRISRNRSTLNLYWSLLNGAYFLERVLGLNYKLNSLRFLSFYLNLFSSASFSAVNTSAFCQAGPFAGIHITELY